MYTHPAIESVLKSQRRSILRSSASSTKYSFNCPPILDAPWLLSWSCSCARLAFFRSDSQPRRVRLRDPSGAWRCAWSVQQMVSVIELWNKNLVTFHYSGCLTGIFLMVYYTPHITIYNWAVQSPIYPKQLDQVFYIAQLVVWVGALEF